MSNWITRPPTEAEVPDSAECWDTYHRYGTDEYEVRKTTGHAVREFWNTPSDIGKIIAWMPMDPWPEPYVPPKPEHPPLYCPECGVEMARVSLDHYWYYQCGSQKGYMHWQTPRHTLPADAYAAAAKVLRAAEKLKTLRTLCLQLGSQRLVDEMRKQKL